MVSLSSAYVLPSLKWVWGFAQVLCVNPLFTSSSGRAVDYRGCGPATATGCVESSVVLHALQDTAFSLAKKGQVTVGDLETVFAWGICTCTAGFPRGMLDIVLT